MSSMGPNSEPGDIQKGLAEGFVVKNNNTTSVKITSGSYEANGKLYTLAADTTHAMTSLVLPFKFHYIYISAASTAPVPTFIDSIVAPGSYDPVRRGWYNVDDRIIGVEPSSVGAATLITSAVRAMSDGIISVELPRAKAPQMASIMDPTGLWQTPDELDGSAVTPINAVSLRCVMNNSDFEATLTLYISNAEFAAIETSVGNSQGIETGYNSTHKIFEINLGVSRNIKIAGLPFNDNALSCWAMGYKYSR